MFAELDGWFHKLNSFRGLHVVMLSVCCGKPRLPWGFKIPRGIGTTSPTDLALRLVRHRALEISARTKHVYLLADAGFSSRTFMRGALNLGLDFTIGMRPEEVFSWPDWGALAGLVRMKLIGWAKLLELEREMGRILAV